MTGPELKQRMAETLAAARRAKEGEMRSLSDKAADFERELQIKPRQLNPTASPAMVEAAIAAVSAAVSIILPFDWQRGVDEWHNLGALGPDGEDYLDTIKATAVFVARMTELYERSYQRTPPKKGSAP